MAIAILETDGWIQHLPFVGGQRLSPYGMVDGTFYGVISGVGDAGGGNFTLNGRLSFDRKEDWVYVVGGLDAVANTTTGIGDVFTQLNTGPLIPTQSAVTNPTFNVGGPSQAITGNAISTSYNYTGGADPRAGLPIFGDKRIPGIFLMFAVGFQTNVDTVTYTASLWGWLIAYRTFFRGVPPAVG